MVKTVAIILAGGVGQRMGALVPKQFIEINGKPIIYHTLSNFERNENVDSILIVCNESWIDYLKSIVEQYSLKKVEWIVPGGKTSHDSIRNGVFHLRNTLSKDDFVIIHDAARPILPQPAINKMVECAHQNGNACLSMPCYETVLLTDDRKSGISQLDRSTIMRIQTPQCYNYPLVLSLYDRAEAEGRHDFVYTNTMAVDYGVRIYFSPGFTNNIKVTTPEDIPLCESLMKFTDDQLFNAKQC